MLPSCTLSLVKYLDQGTLARFLQSHYLSDEPGKPGKPEIIDYDNTMVKLKWEKPEKDGGRPILHYVVEQKDKFSDWTEVRPSGWPYDT